MEERLRTPSIVSDPLRACAHPRGIPATGTQRLATPDRTKHHASSVTIRRDARAPIRSGTGFIRHLCGASGHLRALHSTRRSPSLCFGEMCHRRPRQRFRSACSRLGPPSTACLATCREAGPRCVLIDFCFPLLDYEHPRLVRSRHLFEACASPLANGLAPMTRRPGDLAFHDARSASVGRFGLVRGVLLPRTSDRPYL